MVITLRFLSTSGSLQQREELKDTITDDHPYYIEEPTQSQTIIFTT